MSGISLSQATRSYHSPSIDETVEPIGQAGPGEELARRLQDRHGHLDAR
ncbi:MAG TPA: hypothetical protein HPP50_01725, partial [Rhodospirillaceae bacterium]|nr:hypothetical protein [Rhodospirillaceae bacterium]